MRDSKVTKRAMRLAGLLTAMLVAAALAMPQLAGATPNPPGNNGTVKVDNLPFDDDPNNEPHVGCTFQVDFYGFDAGDLNAEVTFTAHRPTDRPGEDQVLLTDTVFIGEDDNSGAGSTAGLDASRTYTLDLTGITPHPEQGVHVKLTIHADGSKGADTKYKVFWVTGCESSSSTTTTTTKPGGGGGSTTTTTIKHGNGTTTTTTVMGGTKPTSPSGPTTSVGRSPIKTGQPTSSGAASSAKLPFTGSNALPILITGLLLLVAGGGLLVSRRLRTR